MHPSTSRKHWAKNSARVNENAEESRFPIFLENFPDLVKGSKPRQAESENNYSSDSNESSDHVYKPNSIEKPWLYLICGISQDKCQKAIRYIIYIVKNCRQLPQGIEIEKTITRCLKLLAKFEYHVCCQSCYSLYEIEIAPGECGYRATPDSLACGEDLFNPIVFPSWEEIPRALQQRLETCQRNISHRTNPRSIFVSQRFTEWLKWLLCLPGVESSIDEWQEKLNSNAFEIIDYNHSNAFLQSISKNEP
ncbi:hypothetical protein O181_061030 [Austropuccinia psidii MF-1]|uniref:Uncharacterized protein n=1 Tax=Austropuccinia psidii MF-1 TaxID=1389203 RepID=A0A9Q3ELK2_9BASI|nr:hypothetical protein [Austropuccinia psidii MF-1]